MGVTATERERLDAAVAEMFAEGMTWREMAEHLGVPMHNLRHRAYRLGLRRWSDGNKRRARVSQKTLYNRRWQDSHPEKRKAHKAVERALESGTLQKKPCEVCGDNCSEAHHPNYAEPLNVVWLCREHHVEQHSSCVSV